MEETKIILSPNKIYDSVEFKRIETGACSHAHGDCWNILLNKNGIFNRFYNSRVF